MNRPLLIGLIVVAVVLVAVALGLRIKPSHPVIVMGVLAVVASAYLGIRLGFQDQFASGAFCGNVFHDDLRHLRDDPEGFAACSSRFVIMRRWVTLVLAAGMPLGLGMVWVGARLRPRRSSPK